MKINFKFNKIKTNFFLNSSIFKKKNRFFNSLIKKMEASTEVEYDYIAIGGGSGGKIKIVVNIIVFSSQN